MNRRTFIKWATFGAITLAANPVGVLEGLLKEDDKPIWSGKPVDRTTFDWVMQDNGVGYAGLGDGVIVKTVDTGQSWEVV